MDFIYTTDLKTLTTNIVRNFWVKNRIFKEKFQKSGKNFITKL